MFHFLEVGLFDAPVLTNDDTSQSELAGSTGNVIGFAVCQRPWGVREDRQTRRA